METSSPTVCAFKQVQRELDGAISILRKEDEDRREELARSNKKVEQLEDKVQQSAQLISDYQSKVSELETRDKTNDDGLKQLRTQLEDKNKMVKCLVKRIKIYDEILTKKQEEFESSMKKEKEERLLLRKKLKALKNNPARPTTCEEIRLIKKQHKEEIRLMRGNVADHEATIRKLNTERLEWGQVKSKCEMDLKDLLQDYALQQQQADSAQQKIVQMRDQQATLKDQNTTLQEQNKTLKGLYDQLEKKYRETFDEKRSEYVHMKHRVRSVEQENATLKSDISTTSKRYENLLLMNNNHHDHIVENRQLRSRIKDLETWFDEAWAGFRLEILRYERKLEEKDDTICQLKGESTTSRASIRYDQTNSGEFCMQAMKELEGKFKDESDRPEWYTKSLKNLIYESSSLQSTFAMELLEADKKVHQEEVEDKGLSTVEKKKEAFKEDGDELEKDTKEKDEQQVLEEEYEDDFEEISEEESRSDEDPSTSSESDEETGSSVVTNHNTTSDQEEIDHQEASLAEDSAAGELVADKTQASLIKHSVKTIAPITFEQNLTSVGSTKAFLIKASDSDIVAVKAFGQLNKVVDSAAGVLVADKTLASLIKHPVKTIAPITFEQNLTSVGSTKAFLIKASDSDIVGIKKIGQLNKVVSVVDAETPLDKACANSADLCARESSELKASKSILKMISSGSSTKKAISFNVIVDGQVIEEDSTFLNCNKKFLVALKPPQQEKWKVPYVSILDNPRPNHKINVPKYRPINRTPQHLPKWKHVGKLPDQDENTEYKITAADIFGPSKDSKIFDDVTDADDELLQKQNLNDDIDFILNM